jgi:hypothetical protein
MIIKMKIGDGGFLDAGYNEVKSIQKIFENRNLSANSNAISLLEKNYDKINW